MNRTIYSLMSACLSLCIGSAQLLAQDCVLITPNYQGDLFCPNDSLTLTATEGFASYSWYYNFSNSNTGGTLYEVNDGSLTLSAGEWAVTYWYVEVAPNDCLLPSPTVWWDGWVFLFPAIAHDATTTLCPGDSALIENAFPGPVTFQWFQDFAPIPGANDAQYWVHAPGFYTLTVSYEPCPEFFLSSGIGPEFSFFPVSNPPVEVSVVDGGSLLSVEGLGSVQWWFNGDSIHGANASSYLATEAGTYYATGTDNNGCLSSSQQVDVLALSSTGPAAQSEVKVYPNPFSDKIYFESHGTMVTSFRLIDLSGKVVLERQKPLRPRFEQPLPALETGLYFLELTLASGERQTIKMVKR